MVNLFYAWLLLPLCLAINLNDPEFAKYPSIYKLAGKKISVDEIDTPPTHQISTWTFFFQNDTNAQDNALDSQEEAPSPLICPEDAQVCARTVLTKPGTSEPEYVSRFFVIDKSVKPKISRFDEYQSYLSIQFPKVAWGGNFVNVHIQLNCPISYEGEEDDEDERFDVYDELGQGDVYVSWTTLGACPKDYRRKFRVDDSGSWGWFTWIFILMVLIFAGYVIGGAWVNVNRNSGHEFLSELVDSIVEAAAKLPGFLKEIVSRVTGGGDRGGYSAV
ncbi:unnamed protein product [Kuraishia capsulata CBS 1993]|uniref:Uncharacterized protein n=1 Tax=Kuraishia capsulata CBS 1993 TaxID=1382522 RepID=W6MHI1_9ASCO|nr:uncharacterized protein KUCA_T00001416001 [Kuraishia capsulata CBS 1993]CDK25446.1 unnamed protein product [Kuraishia capsulata CBS 1993]